jgi:small-conductance mechanosensitive channel
MNSIQDFGANLYQSFWDVWYGFAGFVPSLIIAIFIFAIAWILGALIQKIVEGIFQSLKIDNLLKTAGLEDVVKRSGYTLKSGAFVGGIIKWFVIVIGLIMAFNEIGLSDINVFLRDVVLSYIPQVLIAVLVLMVSVVIADALAKIVVASARAAHIKSAHLLGNITRWSIWIFAILTALIHLGIAPGLIQTLVLGIVIAISLAVGLAFGLGGKDVAGRMVEKFLSQVSNRE